jgi:hypothetical protein
MPAIDRQGQRAAHPGIVEWLSLVVGLDDPAAVRDAVRLLIVRQAADLRPAS